MARPSLGSPLSAHSGTLVGKLQALQARHLDATLPRLCSELRGEAGRAEAALEALPTAAATVEQRRWRLHQVVQECNHSFGELITASDTSSRHELHVAARSHELCVAFVQRVCERIPNFLSDEALADLAAQVGETRGVYLPNFLNGAVFRRVIKQTFEEPLQQAASQLVEELSSTVKTALSALLATGAAAHPSLRDQLDALAAALVDKERDAAAALAREKVEAEMCAPFTINREYEGLLAQFEEALAAADGTREAASGAGRQGAPPTDGRFFPAEFVRAAAEDIKGRGKGGAERAMTRRLQVSLHAYQHVLQARLFDSIPIDARHRIMFRLQRQLMPALLHDEAALLPLLEEEEPDVAAQRAAVHAKLAVLRQALQKLEKAAGEDEDRRPAHGAATPPSSSSRGGGSGVSSPLTEYVGARYAATPSTPAHSGAPSFGARRLKKKASPRRLSPNDIMVDHVAGVAAALWSGDDKAEDQIASNRQSFSSSL